jgi:superfamily II DNA or RNA helicase
MITARPYQTTAKNNIFEQFKEHNSTLLVMATGLGKTITFAEVARDMLDKGRVMVLAHRSELIFQAKEKLHWVTGIEPDIEMAEFHTGFSFRESPIIVSTIQTQIAGMNGSGRMTKFNPDDFSLLIIDESHHCTASSYIKVLDYYKQNPNLKILGVTATPDRADEQALGKIFESVAFEYDIKDGIDDGWLVDVHWTPVFVEGLDYSHISEVAGDLNQGQLSEELERYENLHQMAEPIIKETGNKKALIFTISVEQAEKMSEILNRFKPDSANWICGKTDKDERANIFRGFKDGKFQYLVNVGVATEGFDEPSIEYVVLGRPTKSRSLCAQMIGRGTRTLPGTVDGESIAENRKMRIALSAKPHLTVLDFVGNAGRHRLVTPADVLGGNYNDEIIERAKKNVEKKGTGDILTELELAEKEMEEERRKRYSEEQGKLLTVRAQYSKARINPFDVLDLEPCREKGWNEGRRPTPGQLAYLEKIGVDPAGLSFTHASQIIDQTIKNRNNGLATFKQSKVLSKFGYDPKQYTFKQASELIDALAMNKWRKLV